MKFMTKIFSVLGVALVASVAACSSDDAATPTADAGTVDSGATVDSGTPSEDGGTVADSGGAIGTTCDGACRITTVKATFGSKSGTITRAYVGYTAPTGGAPVALYVDLDTETDKGCPTDTSSAGGRKKFTLDLPLPLAGSYTKATADARIGFFDTDSSDPWIGVKPEAASAFTVTPTAASLTASGFVALDVDATFPSGSLKGHIYATHCAIFDATP